MTRGDFFIMRRKYICKDVYTVNTGDTLYTIAQTYRVPVGLLMRANRIINPYNLRIGVKLCIPGRENEEIIEDDILPNDSDDMPEEDMDCMPECSGIVYTITAGDTLYMIAKKHRVTLNAIMEANPDMDPYNLMIGTKICIPQ